MIEVSIGGLLPDQKSGSHVLLLRLPSSRLCLPIWIGIHEAGAIAMAQRGQQFERPLTHDLLLHCIQALGAQVSRIVISGIEENTFFARLMLVRDHQVFSIDARPSDCIALAIRANCPILIEDSIIESQREQLVELRGDADGIGEDPQAGASDQLDQLLREVEKGGRPKGGEAEDPGEGES